MEKKIKIYSLIKLISLILGSIASALTLTFLILYSIQKSHILVIVMLCFLLSTFGFFISFAICSNNIKLINMQKFKK